MTQADASPLDKGREAVEKHAWREDYALLTEANGARRLSADDLSALAEAAWWSGQVDDCIDARERAYATYLDEGDPQSAARGREWAICNIGTGRELTRPTVAPLSLQMIPTNVGCQRAHLTFHCGLWPGSL